MPDDDARLTDFVGREPEPEPEEVSVEPAQSPVEIDEQSVEPAEATSRWESGGTECTECENTTERLWRDGGTFVCLACKDW